MRNLIRLLSVFALVGGGLLVTANPSAANHEGAFLSDPSGGYHEAPPTGAVASPERVCVVLGGVKPGTSGTHGEHALPPLINDASHSHFEFDDAVIRCQSVLDDAGQLITTEINVEAEGGNDGHYIDLDTGAIHIPWPVSTGTLHGTGANNGGSHHGSTNESAWSNSSSYTPDKGDNGANTAESNNCTGTPDSATVGSNRNKADITAGNSTGWVKYIRVGIILYVWGCFNSGDLDGQVFSSVLTVFPPQVAPTPPTVPPFPVCLLPDAVQTQLGGQAVSCGFTIAGAAWIGDDWLPI